MKARRILWPVLILSTGFHLLALDSASATKILQDGENDAQAAGARPPLPRFAPRVGGGPAFFWANVSV